MSEKFTILDLESGKVKLTPAGRRCLKSLYMQIWLEGGEGFNRSTSCGEVADVWFEAVLRFKELTDVSNGNTK